MLSRRVLNQTFASITLSSIVLSHGLARTSNDSHFIYLQITCFIICTIVQGTAFARWKKWNAEEKRGGWHLYGWFTSLSCLGSAAGALAYVARIGHIYGIYVTREQLPNQTFTQQLRYSRAVSSRDMMRCMAAFQALFPVELGFVTTANLLVLHRLHRFSALKSQHQDAWRRCERLFLAAVVTCNVIGFVSNIASASQFYETGNLFDDASRRFQDAENAGGALYEQQARDKRQDAARTAAIQRFCEVLLLAMIITAFCIVGVNNYQLILSAARALSSLQKKMREQKTDSVAVADSSVGRELIDEASAQAFTLKRKVLGTVTFTFVSVLARALFTVMFALGAALNNNSDKCSKSECSACKNVYSHMLFWIVYTPVFQQTILLIASPFGSLVALWGMSGVRALEQVCDQLVQLDSAKKLKQNPDM
jgi:hypothetical protein